MEKVFHHGKCLCIANNLGTWIFFCKHLNICCMVRLHMLNDQIIRCCTIQCFLDTRQPLFCKPAIYGIHNRDFFITDHIRIVCHAIRNNILPLKQIHVMIIYAYINNVLCNFHCNTLHISCSFRTAHVHLSFVIHRLYNINRISLISGVHD